MTTTPKTETAAKKDVTKLQRAIVDGLEDVKAQDIQVFDTTELSPLFERVIVASGTSNRQTKALASSVRDAVREAGFPKPRTEGEDNGEWIIVDCGAAVAHIMQPAIRQYYRLEELWGDKPVRLKLGAAKPVAKSADDKPAKKTPAKRAAKATATKAEAKALTPAAAAKQAAKMAAAEAAAAPATKKAPAKKAAAKTASAKAPAKTAAKTASGTTAKAPAKKAPAKSAVKTVVVKPTARKAPAKSAAAKAPAKKAAAKKAPARKDADQA